MRPLLGGKNAQLSIEQRTMKCLLYFLYIKKKGLLYVLLIKDFESYLQTFAVLIRQTERTEVQLCWHGRELVKFSAVLNKNKQVIEF